MDDRDEQEKRLLEDLHYIKEAVKKNSGIIREIAHSGHYRFLFMYVGLIAVFFCIFLEMLSKAYGNFASFPAFVKILLVACLVFAFVSLTVYKIFIINRQAKRIDTTISFFYIFRTFYANTTTHVLIPVVLAGTAASIVLGIYGAPFYILPVISISVGILANLMFAQFRFIEYLVFGYWIILSGILNIVFPQLSGFLWAAITYGGGTLAFVVGSLFARPSVRKQR